MFKAALFDLDGVVFNTEAQYSKFWGHTAETYFPDAVDLANSIKGMTLVQIYDKYCPGNTKLQERITEELDEFEKNMRYEYIPGFEVFVRKLRKLNIKTAVVTSSNDKKMSCVYAAHPQFKSNFDAILTSEDFEKSKPDPDCYLKGAERFGLKPSECVGFEDSINGLKAVNAAKMFTVGLATTNPREVVEQYADIVISDYLHFSPEDIKL